jgi:tRNA dimethylallyltransferase
VLELGLDPPDLAQRIHRRTLALYRNGLVPETEALLARYGARCPLLDTIGYSEARELLAGRLEEHAAISLTERRTRQFAKRQRTWFRRQHSPTWLPGGGGAEACAAALERILSLAGQGLG